MWSLSYFLSYFNIYNKSSHFLKYRIFFDHCEVNLILLPLVFDFLPNKKHPKFQLLNDLFLAKLITLESYDFTRYTNSKSIQSSLCYFHAILENVNCHLPFIQNRFKFCLYSIIHTNLNHVPFITINLNLSSHLMWR